MIGQQFGRLVVIEIADFDPHGRPFYRCLCECGKSHIVRSANLRAGYTRSCGCLRKERARETSLMLKEKRRKEREQEQSDSQAAS